MTLLPVHLPQLFRVHQSHKPDAINPVSLQASDPDFFELVKGRFYRTLAEEPPLTLRPAGGYISFNLSFFRNSSFSHLHHSPSSFRYVNYNRYVENPKVVDQVHRFETAWLPHEERQFVRMFKKVNKDFVKIAASMPTRTVRSVIKFYYANKVICPSFSYLHTYFKHRLGLKRYTIALRSYQNHSFDEMAPDLAELADNEADTYGLCFSPSSFTR